VLSSDPGGGAGGGGGAPPSGSTYTICNLQINPSTSSGVRSFSGDIRVGGDCGGSSSSVPTTPGGGGGGGGGRPPAPPSLLPLPPPPPPPPPPPATADAEAALNTAIAAATLVTVAPTTDAIFALESAIRTSGLTTGNSVYNRAAEELTRLKGISASSVPPPRTPLAPPETLPLGTPPPLAPPPGIRPPNLLSEITTGIRLRPPPPPGGASGGGSTITPPALGGGGGGGFTTSAYDPTNPTTGSTDLDAAVKTAASSLDPKIKIDNIKLSLDTLNKAITSNTRPGVNISNAFALVIKLNSIHKFLYALNKSSPPYFKEGMMPSPDMKEIAAGYKTAYGTDLNSDSNLNLLKAAANIKGSVANFMKIENTSGGGRRSPRRATRKHRTSYRRNRKASRRYR